MGTKVSPEYTHRHQTLGHPPAGAASGRVDAASSWMLPRSETPPTVAGLACRFPGAADRWTFWENLVSRAVSIRPCVPLGSALRHPRTDTFWRGFLTILTALRNRVPPDRWDSDEFVSSDRADGKSVTSSEHDARAFLQQNPTLITQRSLSAFSRSSLSLYAPALSLFLSFPLFSLCSDAETGAALLDRSGWLAPAHRPLRLCIFQDVEEGGARDGPAATHGHRSDNRSPRRQPGPTQLGLPPWLTKIMIRCLADFS